MYCCVMVEAPCRLPDGGLDRGADDADGVDAVVLVEALVLDGDDAVDQVRSRSAEIGTTSRFSR